MVISPIARAYRDEVAGICNGIGPQSRGKGSPRPQVHFPLAIPLSVSIRWYRGRKSGDLDGRLKVLLDAMQGSVYENDSQIVELHAFRSEDKLNPRMEVHVDAA